MKEKRKPTSAEKSLLKVLVNKAKIDNLPKEWLERLMVRNLNDGGMGSLALFPNGKERYKRCFGNEVSKVQFRDTDGILVIATLYLDDMGELYELDIWKTDFSPLKKIPNSFE